jgi:hypothetical protein
MHVFKVSDNFLELQMMKKVTNRTYFIFNLTMFHNLELNAIMLCYGINLFVLNMLSIRIIVKFPDLLVNYFTHPPTIVFFQPSSLGMGNFSFCSTMEQILHQTFCLLQSSPISLPQGNFATHIFWKL